MTLLVVFLASCGIPPTTPKITPDAPVVSSPTSEITPTITPTETPTPTKTPEPTPTMVATEWQVVGKDYRVSLGENGVPKYKFTEETGWQEVEQLSMVDAFGNTVPGWLVEKSEVWEGNIDEVSITYDPKSTSSGGSFEEIDNAVLQQWELSEFINGNGIRLQRLLPTWAFLNNKGDIISLKLGMPDLNREANLEQLTPRELLDSYSAVGQKSSLGIFWKSSMSENPETIVNRMVQYAEEGDLCKLGVEACALSVGRMGEVKHPSSWFDEVINGVYGNNLDLTSDVWVQR